MCGITAILSKNAGVFGFLYQSLLNLQNRGYDSAGICGVTSDGKLVVRKRATDEVSSALERIKQQGENAFNDCMIGIAHTRWATHGGVSDNNSHPHVCYRNKIALVHNGIIENYSVLKNDLMSKGITFKSETDTEVIVNLISYFNTTLPLFKAIKKALRHLEGTWALAIISVDCNKLYFTRHGSPLIMARTETDIVVTSEVAGLFTTSNTYTKYTCIPNGKLFQLSVDTVIDCEMIDIHYSITDVSPYPYEHWTLKEINEQSNIERTLNFGARIVENTIRLGGLDGMQSRLADCKNIVIVGCGTSYHAGLVAEHYFKKLCKKITTRCVNAADFDEDTILYNHQQTAVVFLSQSGETRDLIKCLDICKMQNTITMGIVNVVDSYIARETDCGVYCNAGREVAVASTKSFTAQVMSSVLVALWFQQQYQLSETEALTRSNLINDLKDFASSTKDVLKKLQQLPLNELATSLDKPSMFILGTKGKDKAIALEGALKIKEICYIQCERTYTAALKHGPLALIAKQLPVMCLVSDKEEWSSISNAVSEIQSRHGKTFIIGNHASADIPIETNNEFGFLWNNMVIQLLAYYISVSKGINPDMPRNLAKVVTVG
jgi:glucosamine--fructose-6-phosphate aminotransferase (isomerizing)